jgi:hypothetical protein
MKMKLIITSIDFGFLGLIAGETVGSESIAIAFCIIGFFSQGIYTLERIYEDIKKREEL